MSTEARQLDPKRYPQMRQPGEMRLRWSDESHCHTPVGYRDGAVRDPLGREEAAVREQYELAQEIAQALSTCIERAPKIELGRSAGPRLYRRLAVARASFERLAERDRRTLGEFQVYSESKGTAEAASRTARLEQRGRTARNGTPWSRSSEAKVTHRYRTASP